MFKTPSPKITVRHTTALPKKRAELEALFTREGVERFLTEIGRGTIEAKVSHDVADDESPAATAAREAAGEVGAGEKLALGDMVTVSLPNLEFAGLTSLAQMIAAAKAPDKVKPFIENSPLFGKVGAGLDMAYGLLRGGLTFSSKITEFDSNDDATTYVDEGVELPKVLKSWRHTHKISESGDGGMIVDEIEFEVDPAIAAPVIEGALRMHLEQRSKAYGKVLEQM